MTDTRGDVRHGRTGAYDPRSLAPWVTLLLIILLLAAATLVAPRARAEAPAFTLRSTGYEDGVPGSPVSFSLADYRGRTVVLDFMAVECEPCRAVASDFLLPLWTKEGGRADFAILSIDTWAATSVPNWLPGLETDARLVALQKAAGLPWRHALDTDGVWQKYDAQGLPKLAVVGPDGRLLYTTSDVPDLPAVEAAVRESLLQWEGGRSDPQG
ncbi:MAG: peroxiredoxin family protein [Thermoplasmatota archaeon]|nr:TlpA family protein disulfide reductase [Halobacteriales archaeon]